MWDLASLSLKISIQLFFFPFLFPKFCCCSLCPYIVSTVISLFLALFNVVHPHNLQWRQIIFLLPFLTHIVCLCHLSDVKPCALSSIFWSSGLYFFVPPLFILRMVLSILQEGQLRCLSLLIPVTELGFKKFSHLSESLFSFFFLFDGVCVRIWVVILVISSKTAVFRTQKISMSGRNCISVSEVNCNWS